MYRVVTAFADAQDNEHIYNVGDVFPRTGVTVGKKRLGALSSNRNKYGVVFIANDTHEEASEDSSKASGSEAK